MLTAPPTVNLPRLSGAITFCISYPTVKTKLNLKRYLRAMIVTDIVTMDRIEEESAVYLCGVLARLDSVIFAIPYPQEVAHLAAHLEYFGAWQHAVKNTDWNNPQQVQARWDEFQSVHDSIWQAWDGALLEADRIFSGATPTELPNSLLTDDEKGEAVNPDSPLVLPEESIEPT